MKRNYPCIEVDLKKIQHNVQTIIKICGEHDIEVVGITKGYCAKEPITRALVEAGLKNVGDARILNLKNSENLKCTKYTVRIPMASEALEVVKYSDVSLNSELEVIKALSKAAESINKTHKIVLMVDLGDLREGLFSEDIVSVVKEIIKLPNIELIGIGTNLTCYGGVLADENNLGKLIETKEMLEKTLKISLPIVSGGNSSSLYMVMDGTIPKGITQLRIGEGILLGTESSFAKRIPNTYSDVFTLKAEIVEVKNKPSVPIGTIGLNAFGEVPEFVDLGIRKRAIVAVGRQDIKIDAMDTRDKKMKILGASSDHLILDITECEYDYKIGDIVEFDVKYGCLLQAMTSEYVNKYYIE
ncbi:MAG: alanine/ornithine racemase family PLP-dependent enzyme [Clostridium argentinense]|uniref:Alanine/ornithine racemase family PLP-dependent enzyme n=1 Tax=Clostridium faecium TaxID=2762223 RepID=A0ABR8YWX5_9CLOT|nr:MULTISPECIES: ornithine racemase Orr [Clostridium]MBD8048642.1 alanine/ornithine racemase family PLP-dependent enzyme [Clostridium faecium]MBS5824872.1 alanine/ornithine racemase family PLP-dependent enzyme [Clostridium argentinense]MDU1347762.1 ornithine racemase Orr [Clostridium argentinense]